MLVHALPVQMKLALPSNADASSTVGYVEPTDMESVALDATAFPPPSSPSHLCLRYTQVRVSLDDIVSWLQWESPSQNCT